MSPASLRQRYPVKVRMARDNLTGRLLTKPGVQIAEARSASNVIFCYAVNGDIVGVKVVAWVNKPHFRANFATIFKRDNANLAYAAHARISSLKVNCDKSHLPTLLCCQCRLLKPRSDRALNRGKEGRSVTP